MFTAVQTLLCRHSSLACDLFMQGLGDRLKYLCMIITFREAALLFVWHLLTVLILPVDFDSELLSQADG